MKRHHALTGTLALLVAAAAGWWLLPGRLGDPGAIVSAPGRPAARATAVPCDHSGPASLPPLTAAEVLPPPVPGAPVPEPPPGEASLRIVVTDAATRLPVRTAVVLWRLGLPEDAEWTAGDVVAGRKDAGAEPAVFEGLAPGRYRAQIPGKRMGSEDPPEFTLEPAGAAIDLPVRMPGRFSAWVRLVDEEGRTVPRAEKERRSRESWSGSSTIPAWVRLRERRDGSVFIGLGGGAGGTSCGRPSWSSVEAGARGFELGEFEESSEHRHPRWVVHLRTAASLGIEVAVTGDLLGDTDFVAPAPSRKALLRGLPVAEEDLERIVLTAETTAVPVPAGGSPGLWRTVPVRATASLEGVGRWTCQAVIDGGDLPWEAAAEAPGGEPETR